MKKSELKQIIKEELVKEGVHRDIGRIITSVYEMIYKGKKDSAAKWAIEQVGVEFAKEADRLSKVANGKGDVAKRAEENWSVFNEIVRALFDAAHKV